MHSYPLRIDQEDRSSSQASVYPRSLSLSLLAATEAFHRISIIILAHGTFYTSLRVIMCDGRAAAIERGINNHLITPGQLMLARRINMREGELGIYASTSGEKGGRGVKVWSNVLNELDGYSGTAILNVRPFLNIYSMFPEEGGISYAMHHHSHASTIMSSFRIILALINEPRPWTRTRGTRRERMRESEPWNGLGSNLETETSDLYIVSSRCCVDTPSWFDTYSIFS